MGKTINSHCLITDNKRYGYREFRTKFNKLNCEFQISTYYINDNIFNFERTWDQAVLKYVISDFPLVVIFNKHECEYLKKFYFPLVK